MNLEIKVVRPSKLSSVDCELIGSMHNLDGAQKSDFYDELIENSYVIDEDELDIFSNYKNAIYVCQGYNLKAKTIFTLEIPCDEEIEIDETDEEKIPVITMRPLCQRFADQYYDCEKFWQTIKEFKDFYIQIVIQMITNKMDDPMIDTIAHAIFPYAQEEDIFVFFSFK